MYYYHGEARLGGLGGGGGCYDGSEAPVKSFAPVVQAADSFPQITSWTSSMQPLSLAILVNMFTFTFLIILKIKCVKNYFSCT